MGPRGVWWGPTKVGLLEVPERAVAPKEMEEAQYPWPRGP